MTYQDMEQLGWKTVAIDTNSFVSKTDADDVWLELFYCDEKKYLQIMRGMKGGHGEITRQSLYEGKYLNMNIILQFLK